MAPISGSRSSFGTGAAGPAVTGTTVTFGANDLFLATYFTPAHYIKHILPSSNRQSFVYLIQDYEPAFFEWSSNYAWALETYGMNFRAMPELDWSLGYPLALGLMALSIATPFWYFHRKGWLK